MFDIFRLPTPADAPLMDVRNIVETELAVALPGYCRRPWQG